MISKFKKMGITIVGLALLVMASIPNQAKAFTVNDTDLYLILSNNSTEVYVDLGTEASVLTTGVSNLNISSLVTTASGASDVHWTLVSGNLGTGDLFFTNLQNNLNGSATGVAIVSGLTQWGSFQTNTTSTLAQGNANSYYSLFDGGGASVGTLGGTVAGNQVNGTINHNGSAINQTMSLYQGNMSDNVLHLLSMVANVSGSGSGTAASYFLNIAVSAVPVPPSLVMFVTGLIALTVIARRKHETV